MGHGEGDVGDADRGWQCAPVRRGLHSWLKSGGVNLVFIRGEKLETIRKNFVQVDKMGLLGKGEATARRAKQELGLH